MMNRHRIAAGAAVVFALLGAGACSGGDDGSASGDGITPTATADDMTPTPESTPDPTPEPSGDVEADGDEVLCVDALAPTDAPPPPEVVELTEIATIDTSVWRGELPRDEDLVVAGATLLGIVDGVAARVDLSTGIASEVEVSGVRPGGTLVGASFTAPGSWWLTVGDDTTGTHTVIEVDSTTGCEVTRFESDAALEPILVDGANLWAGEVDSGDLHLRSYPDGEFLDVVEEDVSNWEITTAIGGDLAQIGFCGDVSALPGNGIDPPYEGRLGDGDQCGDRWGADGDVIVASDDFGDAEDPSQGWWFDMSGITIGYFALPFDVVHVDPDSLGAWVVAGDGTLWRLPAPSTRAVGVVQGCLDEPPPARPPVVLPGQSVELADDVVDPAVVASPVALFGLLITVADQGLGWVNPVDGSVGTWDVQVSLVGADVIAPDGLWMVTRVEGGTQLLGVEGGCVDDVVTTGVEATGVVTATASAVWVRTADDIVAVDRTTGLVVDDLAAVLARSTLTQDDVSALPADLVATGAVVGIVDRDGDGFLLTGACGVSLAVDVTEDRVSLVDPQRCDLDGFVPSPDGTVVGWTPDGNGGSQVAVIAVESAGVVGTEQLVVPIEVVSAVVGEDVVYLLSAEGTVNAIRP